MNKMDKITALTLSLCGLALALIALAWLYESPTLAYAVCIVGIMAALMNGYGLIVYCRELLSPLV